MTNINIACTAKRNVFTSPFAFVRESYREEWSFSVAHVGEYIVLSEVHLDGKPATCCYTCLASGLSGCIRQELTEAGVPESQPAILIWPGETQCWAGGRLWYPAENGVTLQAPLWEELSASLPSSLEELAKAADDLAMRKSEEESAAWAELANRERLSG